MLIQVDPNDLKFLDEVLAEHTTTTRDATRHVDELREKFAVNLLSWQTNVDIVQLAKMVEANALTREEAITICTRNDIPTKYVLKAKPQTSIVDTLKDR